MACLAVRSLWVPPAHRESSSNLGNRKKEGKGEREGEGVWVGVGLGSAVRGKQGSAEKAKRSSVEKTVCGGVVPVAFPLAFSFPSNVGSGKRVARASAVRLRRAAGTITLEFDVPTNCARSSLYCRKERQRRKEHAQEKKKES